MKKIVIKTVKKLLNEINCDESTIELITNNVHLYNGLVEEYMNGERHNLYLMYQLNNQIIKQIESAKKLSKAMSDAQDVDDAFTTMLETIKPKSSPVVGFNNNKKKDIETRNE